MTDLATSLRAFAETWQGLAEVCGQLTDEQWAAPTDLPGWSVKDNVSHVVAEELFLLGEPGPDHELPADLPHVKSDFARSIEVPIDFRRALPGAQVLAELKAVTARRLDVLRNYTEADLDETVDFAGRNMPLRTVLGIRAFDCWTHEQDVRRAVGVPLALDGLGAALTQARLLRALAHWADEVPAAAGRTVILETTGPRPTTTTLALGGVPADGEPAVRITTDFETFLLLTTGRAAYDAVAAGVALEGDIELGRELCRHMAVTP
jgi:uncharacterized protein (TIGR03083 family)